MKIKNFAPNTKVLNHIRTVNNNNVYKYIIHYTYQNDIYGSIYT